MGSPANGVPASGEQQACSHLGDCLPIHCSCRTAEMPSVSSGSSTTLLRGCRFQTWSDPGCSRISVALGLLVASTLTEWLWSRPSVGDPKSVFGNLVTCTDVR